MSISLTSDNFLEGLFWGSWFAISLNGWNEAIDERQFVDHLPNHTPEKTQKIWEANKKLLLSNCSLASGFSMIFSWLNEVKILSLGVLGPIISSLGYGGSCLVSLSKVYKGVTELNQGIEAYFKIQDPRARHNMALCQIQNMIKVALFACTAAWAALGVVHAMVGGAALFALMDSCFYAAFLTFLANLGYLLAMPLLEDPKT